MEGSGGVGDSTIIPHFSKVRHFPDLRGVPIFRQTLPDSLRILAPAENFFSGWPSGETRLSMTPERRAPDTILRTAEIQHERVTIVKRIGVDGAVRILSAIIKAENRISLFHWKTQP